MIKSKKEYKEYLKYEKNRYYKSYPHLTKEHKNIMKFLKIYRKKEYYYNCKKNIFLKKIIDMKYDMLCEKYSIFIPINTIEKGLTIVHLGPIYINKNAKIGQDLRIHPMTTIAPKLGSKKAPIIKKGVWIGPGARIYGNITIGDNIVIGANSVVNKSFESNITIAGIPAKKINSKKYLDYFHKDKKEDGNFERDCK